MQQKRFSGNENVTSENHNNLMNFKLTAVLCLLLIFNSKCFTTHLLLSSNFNFSVDQVLFQSVYIDMEITSV